MTKKNFENGRSMVEMLGVLAVIGVLSVAGIAGYNSAVNKHRANELMNAVSMRLMTLAAQRAQGTQLSLSEFGTGKVGSSTISVDAANTNAIVLSLSDVPAAVCQNMFNTKGANVVKMTSNGVELTSASGCVDGKAVTVTFNNDLSVETGDVSLSDAEVQQDGPCSYPDKYVCDTNRVYPYSNQYLGTSGEYRLIYQCQEGKWTYVTSCDTGCKQSASSSLDGVCEHLAIYDGDVCFNPGKYATDMWASDMVMQCINGYWKNVALCLVAPKSGILGDTIEDICDMLD